MHLFLPCQADGALYVCSLYAMPPWTFFGGPTMRLHVILGFTDTPQGKKITYQVSNFSFFRFYSL
jgi:hypothetical protein